jgi:hypothetical protein
MEAIEITETEQEKAVGAEQDTNGKKVAEFPSMFGSSRTVPSPDWAQYAAAHANNVTRTRRAARGIF